MMVEKAQPSIPEKLSPSNIMTGVLSELATHEEVAESQSSDKGESRMLQP